MCLIVYAASIITSVQHPESIGNRAVGHNPSDPMSVESFLNLVAAKPNHPIVSVCIQEPLKLPARCREFPLNADDPPSGCILKTLPPPREPFIPSRSESTTSF